MRLLLLLPLAALLACAAASPALPAAQADALAAALRALDPHVFPPEERPALAGMVRADLQRRTRALNERDRRAWERLDGRAAWERFRAPRLAALRRSLDGEEREPAGPPPAWTTRTYTGTGYRLECLAYESRPGVLVPALLYLPAAPPPAGKRMPLIVLVHSHHQPHTQGELQDMGVLWARQGAAVLVPEQPGYGERREHRPGSRQDYRFRYVTALQLEAVGESLIGWMVHDVRRGLDLLLARGDVDPARVALIGAVAGGGDPAAVAAALDPRITCAVPFNFGGPQPETRYPLPPDAETWFNYLGGGSWESTRNLRESGRGGFLPWVIVGGIAPRRLVYAHEFNWDRERDPVWRRLQHIYGLYGAAGELDYTHGAGLVTGQPPEATHCNNVGPVQRRRIYQALARWFGMAPPPSESGDRRPEAELACLTPELKARALPLRTAAAAIGSARAAATGERPGAARLRTLWRPLLGDVEPRGEPAARSLGEDALPGVRAARVALETEPGITVPLLLLTREGPGPHPVAVGLAQAGKAGFLRERAAEIASLLRRGVAVCLPDLRGCGETSPPGGRDRQTEATSLSATERMLCGCMLGARLRDLRAVLRWLRGPGGAERIALWGDSFSPTNPTGFRDPLLGEEPPPPLSEPGGGILALLGALFEPEVRAVSAAGTLNGCAALLDDTACWAPQDALVPGAVAAGDLPRVAAALAPRPLRLERLVDGRNVPAPAGHVRARFEPALRAYAARPDRLELLPEEKRDVAAWLAAGLEK